MTFAQMFGLNLCHARLALEWTQADLAAKSGVRRESISGYERGVTIPSVDKAFALADALGVYLDDLIRDPRKAPVAVAS